MSKTRSQITEALQPLVSNADREFDESRTESSNGIDHEEIKEAVRDGVREGLEEYHERETTAEKGSDRSSSGSSRHRLLTLGALASSVYLYRRRRRQTTDADASNDSESSE